MGNAEQRREAPRVALIGYGEVGRTLAEELRAGGHDVTAFDSAPETESQAMHARAHGVNLAASPGEAVATAGLVISAVNHQQAVAAAGACVAALPAGAFYLDLNSVSPATKQKIAELIGSAYGRFVEGALTTSLRWPVRRCSLLLGGPYAAVMAPILEKLGLSAQLCSLKPGQTSATVMCRKAMRVGLEALVVEVFTAARHYGVEANLLASLSEAFPAIDWERQVTDVYQQAIEQGRRAGEELREAAASVRDMGLEPWSTQATAARADWMADLADAGSFGTKGQAAFARSPDWRVEADRILKLLGRRARRGAADQKNVTISEGNAPPSTAP
ncbi:MAG TPA: NAD(P)-binding domain-containing protein [Polyangia bacterium]|nr:NAD(P)-binding domain-containing protein [Polyangia bacterium]